MANSRKEASSCPVENGLSVIGGRWKAQILWCLLHEGVMRYGELKRAVAGVTEKMLIQQLRELEGDGIIERRSHETSPPRVDYALTALGESLRPVVDALWQWSVAHRRDALKILSEE